MMNKLLLVAFSYFLLSISCTPRVAQNTQNEVDVTQQDSTNIEKPKYKSEIRQELVSYFTHQKQDDVTEQIRPKGISFNGNAEGIYCYFFIKNKKALSLKLHIQFPTYDADFIELHVDGESEAYDVNKSYSSDGMLNTAETYSKRWYDKSINLTDEELLRKAANSENAFLVFKTNNNQTELGRIKLSKEQSQTLVRTIDYYLAQSSSAKIPKKGMVNIRG